MHFFQHVLQGWPWRSYLQKRGFAWNVRSYNFILSHFVGCAPTCFVASALTSLHEVLSARGKPISIVTSSENFNCIVCLIVPFVWLLHELCALCKLHYWSICSGLEQMLWCRLSEHLNKGRMSSPKVMNFWKRSKRPLIPPPSFSENHVALFFRNTWPKKRL